MLNMLFIRIYMKKENNCQIVKKFQMIQLLLLNKLKEINWKANKSLKIKIGNNNKISVTI